MTFQPESFVAATEATLPRDVRDALRAFAKSARAARQTERFYPRRNELMATLADARACIDRINAPVA